MGGAGRCKAREDVTVCRQRTVTAKRRFRLAAVEEHVRDALVLGKQGRKVVLATLL